MENFIVSARKYRPATFDTVVGQSSITTTLKNAIKNNHLAQAYLFCGPRGVGKTTNARIFAKTINCQNLSTNIEACNQCESCLSFNENRSYNIHELDAASNNSVDDIRSLIDQVRIPPQIGKYSVYIIDEVHMLSASAFNAFLKTLEEPPRHALFILATTEKHKILPTILSRCQIFDFNRMSIEDITRHLQGIAEKEGIEAENDALNVIAQKADGGMRDALSIFDQIVSFSGKSLTYKSVIENLNILDYDYYFRLTDAFIAEQIAEALIIFNEILADGFDAHHFIGGLASHMRDLLVCKDPATLTLLEVGEKIREKYKLQSASCESDFLFSALEILEQCDVSYKQSRNQRLHVEMALIKICRILSKKKKIAEQSAIEETKTDKSAQASTSASASTLSSVKTSGVVQNSSGKQPEPLLPRISAGLQNARQTIQRGQTPASETVKEPESQVFYSEKVTLEALKSVYFNYIEKYKDNARMYSSLSTASPELKGDTEVELLFENAFTQEIFDKEYKFEFTELLKTQLKNQLITLTTGCQRRENQQFIYTDEDKLRHLSEKYPQLNAFRQRFHLDFDTK